MDATSPTQFARIRNRIQWNFFDSTTFLEVPRDIVQREPIRQDRSKNLFHVTLRRLPSKNAADGDGVWAEGGPVVLRHGRGGCICNDWGT
jgi:hypothetical protein